MKLLERLAWCVAVLILLACVLWCAITEPITPDADDCAARGRAEDCWKDVYDEQGRLVLPEKGKEPYDIR